MHPHQAIALFLFLQFQVFLLVSAYHCTEIMVPFLFTGPVAIKQHNSSINVAFIICRTSNKKIKQDSHT